MPEERLRLGIRRGLYCCDDCLRSRRRGVVVSPRPQELELLDRGVGCSLPRCLELADSWLAGAGSWDGPYCIPCFELVLERLEAIAIVPSLAATLPPLEAAWATV